MTVAFNLNTTSAEISNFGNGSNVSYIAALTNNEGIANYFTNCGDSVMPTQALLAQQQITSLGLAATDINTLSKGNSGALLS